MEFSYISCQQALSLIIRARTLFPMIITLRDFLPLEKSENLYDRPFFRKRKVPVEERGAPEDVKQVK